MTDPYAPFEASPPPPPNRLPVTRLERLGATEKAMVVLSLWWDRLNLAERTTRVGELAVMTDAQMSAWVEAVGDLVVASANSVWMWVERSDSPDREAAIALVVEETRPRQRANLLAKLDGVVHQKERQ